MDKLWPKHIRERALAEHIERVKAKLQQEFERELEVEMERELSEEFNPLKRVSGRTGQ